MFFVISSTLFYYSTQGSALNPALDPLAKPSTPWAPCLNLWPPVYALDSLATPSPLAAPWAPLAAPMAHCRPSNVKLHLSTSTWSPSWLSLPSTSRGLLQPRPRPLCGWPPNERLRDTDRVTVTVTEYDQYIDIQQQKTYQGG